MSNPEIISTEELAEAAWDTNQEPDERVASKISATEKPEGSRFEFHVQMRGFTMNEMDNLIVEAAARLIVGNGRERKIAEAIEAKCIELVDAKASAALAKVTERIIDAPMTPNYGDRKPVTMREFIGLYGREYLTALVDREGKPITGSVWHDSSKPRIDYLVERSLDGRFKTEIEKATNAAFHTMKNLITTQHNTMLAVEKKRLADALAASLTVK
jgi:hypothetical protein